MMLPLMTTPDGLEVVYSDIRKDSKGKDFVRVYGERWNESKRRFDSFNIIFPDNSVEYDGFFNDNNVKELVEKIKGKSKLIWELAGEANAKLR